jgi:hypothetical protein
LLGERVRAREEGHEQVPFLSHGEGPIWNPSELGWDFDVRRCEESDVESGKLVVAERRGEGAQALERA